MVLDETKPIAILKTHVGTLKTRIVTSGKVPHVDSKAKAAHLDLDSDKHKWIDKARLSWFAPQLKYFGNFDFNEYLRAGPL
jgi:hypothetical protein